MNLKYRIVSRRTCPPCNTAAKEAGFTLLEVMASVVIIGVAMTVIMTDRNDSVRRVAITDCMRTATMLAQQKVAEIILGMEANTSGEFEDYEGFSWRLEDSTTEIMQGEEQSGTLNKTSLVVTYPAGPAQAQLTLSLHQKGGQ